MIVVDTNVLSEPMRSEPDSRVLAWLARHAGELAVTAISVSELRYGVLRLPEGRRRAGLARALDALIGEAAERLLPFDAAAAEHGAALRARRESAGRVVSVEDTMIAAICLAGGHALATRNVRDFDDLGIEVVDPWQG